MKKAVLPLIVLTSILASCGQNKAISSPSGIPNELLSDERETYSVNIKTGAVNKVSNISDLGISVDTCFFTWNNVHASSAVTTEVKGDWTGYCPATRDPHYVMPYVSALYKQNVSTGNFLPRVLIKQTETKKYISSSRVDWIRTEIFATAVCTSGKYRSELKIRAFNPDGASVPLVIMPILSGVSEVFC